LRKEPQLRFLAALSGKTSGSAQQGRTDMARKFYFITIQKLIQNTPSKATLIHAWGP
jgi:hypothetical protein